MLKLPVQAGDLVPLADHCLLACRQIIPLRSQLMLLIRHFIQISRNFLLLGLDLLLKRPDSLIAGSEQFVQFGNIRKALCSQTLLRQLQSRA